eukprot:XP_027302415.1 avidin-like [Anas platyrhynchos]
MGSGAFALALLLALVVCISPAERKCQLSGLWRNEQDSLMEISALTDDGGFQGEYLTRVTLAGGCPRVSPLKGAQQQPSEVASPTFAFTVRWDVFSNATTTFAGQCFVEASGREVLSTTWLLREPHLPAKPHAPAEMAQDRQQELTPHSWRWHGTAVGGASPRHGVCSPPAALPGSP